MNIKEYALDVLFPKTCFGCEEEGAFLCTVCTGLLRFVPPSCFGCGKLVPQKGHVPAGRTCDACQDRTPIYSFLSPFQYEDETIRNLIHALKYNRVQKIAVHLGELLCRYSDAFGVAFPSETIVIPIPLHPWRERRRGFNQSALIARCLCEENSNLSCNTALLFRVKNTKPQIELSHTERTKNLTGSFAVRNLDMVRDKTILLLDDVKTTGSTIEEAARTLKEAGAKRVWAMTVAH